MEVKFTKEISFNFCIKEFVDKYKDAIKRYMNNKSPYLVVALDNELAGYDDEIYYNQPYYAEALLDEIIRYYREDYPYEEESKILKCEGKRSKL